MAIQENQIVHEKGQQAVRVLAENEIDCWLIFARESAAGVDPVLPLLYGHEVTWQSAFLFHRNGQRIALLGRFDAENARRQGVFDQVLTYDQSIQPLLLQLLHQLDPQQLALNYSTNDAHADGLGHGLYLLLQRYLAQTPYADRIVSAEPLVSALRGRKTAAEIERVRAAIRTTEEIYEETFARVQPGMTEAEIGRGMLAQLDARGLATSWARANCPAVNTGKMPAGHAGPTADRVQRGHLLHFDFGLCQDGYCSDIQRVLYLLRQGEERPPEPVQRGFDTIVRAIEAAVQAMRPGTLGCDVDAAARAVVTEAGYSPYQYATGHQIGRHAHDGGGTLAPRWDRYGDTPTMPLEADQIYAVEPGLLVEGFGYIGIEENVLVTADGARFLSRPQTELHTV